MNTLEMMIKAREDGKTYRTGDLFYNRITGFVNAAGDRWKANASIYLNDIFNLSAWEQDTRTYMTKSEAEQKYNIVIMED